jgi:hypothetical protein
MRLLIGLMLLVSTSVFAKDWSDLELGGSYKLTQSFELKQLERSGSALNVEAGQAVVLKEMVPVAVPGYPLYLYIFDYKSCPGPAMKTDQEIIPVKDTSPLVEVGVELEVNCELNVYLETKDFYSNSLFE